MVLPPTVARRQDEHIIQVAKLGKRWQLSATAAVHVTGSAMASDVIRIVGSVDIHVDISSDASATGAHDFIPAGVVEYFSVRPNVDYISVIRNASTGTVWITEME